MTARADVYGSIHGQVVSAAGAPVSGATVIIKSETEGPLTTHTDPGGRYEFARVTFDTYTITVTAPGFEQQSNVVTVSSGSVVTANFTMGSKTLARIVTRAEGTRAAPVSVDVISRNTIAALPSNNLLAGVVETVPGIVPFSYNEPVARGYHGITYEVDGVPMPQTASSQFSEIVDPRDIDHIEVFTGAIPAEFGGEREGAVVDIITKRALGSGQYGQLSIFGGSYGTAGTSFNDTLGSGPFHVTISANVNRNSRGIDTPTFVPNHDDSSTNDQFIRTVYSPNSRDTWSSDFSNQYSAFQIPIDTNPSDPRDPAFSVPGTDDSQHEYDRFANILYNRLSADGKGYFEIGPWYRRSRVTYVPDPTHDLLGGAMISAAQDRIGRYTGLTGAWFRGGERHNVKVGFSGDVQNFTSTFSILAPSQPTFFDNVAQKGFEIGVYAEDKWYLSPVLTLNYGVRWDHSTGFVSGHQLSPRAELNIQADPRNTLHLFYGRFYAAPALEDTRRDAVVVGGGSGTPVYDLRPERDSMYEMGINHQVSPLVDAYATLWFKNVQDVLDTTQIGSTPIFTIFNSAVGRAQGLELNVTGHNLRHDSFYVSYGLSQSLAKGISGGTFLFSPNQLQGANSFAPEDHDQTNTMNAAYTRSLAGDQDRYLTLQTLYGSGFPAQFENGQGRLPAHTTLNLSYGVKPASHGRNVGWEIQANNVLDDQYLIKLNNGFNTTQFAAGRQITGRLIFPIK